MKKKMCSLLVVFTMLLSMLPMSAMAYSATDPKESAPLKLRISFSSFWNPNTKQHDINGIDAVVYLKRNEVGSDNTTVNMEAWFEGSNEAGWSLTVKITAGDYEKTFKNFYNAKVYNKDMSEAKASKSFTGFSFNAAQGSYGIVFIFGAKDLPKPEVKYILNYDTNGGSGAPAQQTGTSNTGSYTFTISTAVPTREGYEFKGWALTNNATVAACQSGGSITVLEADNPETLYAVWGENTPPAPEKPSANDLKVLLGNNIVKIDCGNTEITPEHADEAYGLIEDSYTIGNVTGNVTDGYACVITINSEKYIAEYNKTASGHEKNSDEDDSKTITLTWNEEKWKAPEGVSVTFEVKCATPETPVVPDAPADDDLSRILTGDEIVVVDCINSEVSHANGTYGLLAESYTIGDVTGDATGGYACVITINSEKYIAEYNKTASGHEKNSDEDDSKTITLTWNEEKWEAPADASVTFQVKCKTPEEPKPETKYTVTYTDGVDGVEAFADQSTGDLSVGDATPAFDGTPARTGYVFAGWNPEVAEKVAAPAEGTIITYTATWKVDCNENGVADEDEYVTVTYTDGVDGAEVFADQVYNELLAGDATPTFVGTLARHGYVFDGWTPAVAATVTADATYVATWKIDRNGNSVADEDEYVTVIYTDGVKNEEVFEHQIYDKLLIGDATPIFDDSDNDRDNYPERKGYRFMGWEPDWTATVTGSVVYVAQWSRIRDYDEPEVTPAPTVKVRYLNTTDHVAYIIGYTDGTVQPDGEITRAEVATIFFRLMTEDFRDKYWDDSCSYIDVADSAWYNVAISTLENADIIQDTVKGGQFRPNEPITRAELAVMAAQFCTVTGNIPSASFKDVTKSHWAADEIALVEYVDWIEGYNGYYRPDDNLSRAECVTIINRMLQRGAEVENMLTGMVTFSDNLPGDWYYEAIQEAANSHDYTRTIRTLTGEDFRGEKWTELNEAPDWAALEKSWAAANSK